MRIRRKSDRVVGKLVAEGYDHAIVRYEDEIKIERQEDIEMYEDDAMLYLMLDTYIHIEREKTKN